MKFPIIAGLAVLIFLAVISFAQEKRRIGSKATPTPSRAPTSNADALDQSDVPAHPEPKKVESDKEKFLATQAAARQAEAEKRKKQAVPSATPPPAPPPPAATPPDVPAPAATPAPATTPPPRATAQPAATPAPAPPTTTPSPVVTTRQQAAPPNAPDPPAQLVAEFFRLLAKGDLDLAYGGLTKGSKVLGKAEDVRELKLKTKEAIEVFGAITGHELVETKPIGSRLLRRTYLSLGSEFPLRWRFYFYQANGTWRLIDMRVDDQLVGLFDEEPERREPGAKLSLQP